MILNSLKPAHRIMAWIMSRDGIPTRCSRPFRALGDLELRKKSKPETLLEFFTPCSSPVWSALSDGCMGFHESRAADHWRCFQAYHRGSQQAGVLKIWQSQLPVLVHIWSRLVELLLSWPQRLLLLLSESADVRRSVAQVFPNLKKCCVPRGVHALHSSCATEAQTLAYDKKVLVQELSWQLDLSIFDRETSHAATKHHIQACNGRAPSFENVAEAQVGKEVWQHFSAAAGHGEKLKRKAGRPKNVTEKRLRYDAWNAYVAANKPAGRGQAKIASGNHMQVLAEQWAREPAWAKQKYADLAATVLQQRKAKQYADAIDAEDDEQPPESVEEALGHWDLACTSSPMCANAMAQPVATKSTADQVDSWATTLGEQVKHKDGTMPSKVNYDEVCRPLLCRNMDEYIQAEPAAIAFSMAFAHVQAADVFLLQGETSDGYSVELQMVGSRIHAPQRKGNNEFVFIGLEPHGDTCLADIESGVNFPWKLQFRFAPCTHSQKMTLVFKRDVSVFMDMMRGAADLEIQAAQCNFCPVSYWGIEVASLEKPVMLQNNMLADMDDIMEKKVVPSTETGDWSWAEELAGLGDGQNRDNEGVEGPDEDFVSLLDPEVRAMLEGIPLERAMEEAECDGLESLASDAESTEESDDDADAYGGVPAGSADPPPRGRGGRGRGCRGRGGRGGGVVDVANNVAHDDSLDRHLVPHKGIFNVIDDLGAVVGQIHPRWNDKGAYIASALCKHDHHKERCTRTRNWKVGKEPMEAPDRILINWLFDAHMHKSTAAHMDAPRL